MSEPNYKDFAKWIAKQMWQSYDLDCGDVQEALARFGIIKEVPYDPEAHGESEYDMEPGDPWYVLVEP